MKRVHQLLLLLAATHLVAALSNHFSPAASHLFALSPLRLRCWQIGTNLFVPPQRFSLHFLLHLSFQLLLLWHSAMTIAVYRGSVAFLRLFFAASLFASTVVYLLLLSCSLPEIYGGLNTPLHATLFAAAFLAPHLHVTSLFLIALPLKWLAPLLLATFVASELAFGHLVAPLASLSGCLFTIIFCNLAWGVTSPFPLLNPLEERLIGYQIAWRCWRRR